MNLSLSGGGARSAFQAGVIEALVSAGIEFNHVSCISGGVINGYFLKTGQVDFLREFWLEILPAHASRFRWYAEIPLNIIRGKKGLFSPSFIMSLVKKYVTEIPEGLSFDIVSMFDGKQMSINSSEFASLHQFQSAIYATMAIPVAFPPIDIETQFGPIMDCADGGLYYPLSENTSTEALKIITQFDTADYSRVRGLMDAAFKVAAYRRDEALNNLTYEPNMISPYQPLSGVWDWKTDSLLRSYSHGLEVGRRFADNIE